MNIIYEWIEDIDMHSAGRQGEKRLNQWEGLHKPKKDAFNPAI